MAVKISPISPSERIKSLDVLRGFAILGILVMNIQSYSMIEAAYINPMAYGDLSGINKWAWIISHIFADQKFISIFSILFGAGILLMSNRTEAKGLSATNLHYRRILWLFIIGMLHAYILWHGDILVTYALCGLLVFLFRKKTPVKLLAIGLIAVSVTSIIYILGGYSVPYWPPESYQGTMQSWLPGAELVERELQAFQGGWLQQMEHRVPAAIKFQTFLFLMYMGWRAGGLMLIGMALFKWGVLTAERPRQFYVKLIIVGICTGLPLIIYGIIRNFVAGWSLEFSMFLGSQFNYWGSIPLALAYIGMIMLICQTGTGGKIMASFSAIGRMALTNYLLQSLICTIIFYGHGFGYFGKIERLGQLVIVLAIWCLQLLISPYWLRYFQFGPVEWLWRSLTYGHLQPMKKNVHVS